MTSLSDCSRHSYMALSANFINKFSQNLTTYMYKHIFISFIREIMINQEIQSVSLKSTWEVPTELRPGAEARHQLCVCGLCVAWRVFSRWPPWGSLVPRGPHPADVGHRRPAFVNIALQAIHAWFPESCRAGAVRDARTGHAPLATRPAAGDRRCRRVMTDRGPTQRALRHRDQCGGRQLSSPRRGGPVDE